MKNNNEKKIFGFLGIVFVFVVAFSYLSWFYELNVNSFNQRIFPSNEGEGYSLFSAVRIVDPPEEAVGTTVAKVSLKPGEKYIGKAAIKNHDLEMEHKYELAFLPFKQLEEGGEDIDESSSIEGVIFEMNDLGIRGFSISPNEVQIFEYLIELDDEVLEGSYSGIIGAKQVDNAKKHNVSSDPNTIVNLELAMGLPVFLNVSAEALPYEYLDLSLQAHEKALIATVRRGAYVMAGGLFVLSLYFGLMAFKLKK